eukprot:scaffold130930_cov63-Phaeocystis_antarctica.AAC.1
MLRQRALSSGVRRGARVRWSSSRRRCSSACALSSAASPHGCSGVAGGALSSPCCRAPSRLSSCPAPAATPACTADGGGVARAARPPEGARLWGSICAVPARGDDGAV